MPSDKPLLSDFLGTQRSITVFASFLRQHASSAALLDDESSNATVLAPLNSALPDTPWELPRDYNAFGADAYQGAEGKERADQNIQHFVDAHLIPKNPWPSGEKVKTMAGAEVWWEEKDGKRILMPDKIEVDKVANQAPNGELWIIKGTLKHD
ncbi:hypothetical protein B0I35DRAFT_480241 [Stachybotrys elegans]|uniref:FAS1 domain-containing protein n=1 Tax=Stachybotrys elegans TaxID=80388 RepID=A0A8K0WQX6_9HYPO|nr:hypothetical protein B0I35DRAFT_480241 [Stachybotrys elegans]